MSIDLSQLRNHWEKKSEELDSFCELLEKEVQKCEREPLSLKNKKDGSWARNEARLMNCVAFGQHLQVLKENQKQAGQAGGYGTAAAMELLAHSSDAKKCKKVNSAYNGPDEWKRQLLGCWNFLDLFICELSEVTETKYWEQSQTTLRICSLIRAVSSASTTLNLFRERSMLKFGTFDFTDYLIEKEEEEESKVSSSYLRKIVCRLLKDLEQCKIAHQENMPTDSPGNLLLEATYKYAVNADEVPESWNDWLFVWSSVVVSVVTARRANLLTDVDVKKFVSKQDINRMMTVLKNDKLCTHNASRLYALWALDHINPARYMDHRKYTLLSKNADSTGRAKEARLPSDLCWDNEEVKKLGDQVQACASVMLRRDTNLFDVHIPYQIFFNESGHVGHRDEYYVIPTLPLLIDQVSRHRPSWVFRPRIIQLLNNWVQAVADNNRSPDGSLSQLPYQVGNYNGTVNTLYYHKAAGFVSKIWKEHKRALGYRVWGTILDHKPLFVILTAIPASLLFFWLRGGSSLHGMAMESYEVTSIILSAIISSAFTLFFKSK